MRRELRAENQQPAASIDESSLKTPQSTAAYSGGAAETMGKRKSYRKSKKLMDFYPPVHLDPQDGAEASGSRHGLQCGTDKNSPAQFTGGPEAS